MYCDLLWLVFKSGFQSRAGYSGAHTVYAIWLGRVSKTSDYLWTFPNCLDRCPGNRCRTNDSIEMGDQEQEQIELLDIPNQRNNILETEHELGSYKEEQIDEDKSNYDQVCPNCDDNSLGSYYCKTCDEKLCDRCYKTHSKLKITRDHDVITIQ